MPASHRLLLLLMLLSVGTASACAPGATDAPAAGPALVHIDGLGSLSFPNSGAAGAQASFLRGVLLLHSFEFDPAAEAFREAQTADPAFALAYWGEAMTYNHPLWQQQDADAARAVLARLAPTPLERAMKAPTPRERQYVEAVETLYGAGTKTERDQAYMRAMARLQEGFPEDMEARTFHALAILGSRDGARDFATYMRAAATAQPAFDANPNHPGAAHYLIHSFDDPIHAPLGLPAARRYAEIAPEASHAQHMTSHIFVALGLWDDVIAANVRASDTQNSQNLASGGKANVCGHYSSWLQYGYLMRGETAQAEALMEACHVRMADQPSGAERNYFASMRARQVLDTEDWALASRWTWPDGHAPAAGNAGFDYAFTNAFAGLKLGDPVLAQNLIAGAAPTDPNRAIHIQELQGLLALHQGQSDAAVAHLRDAASAEDALPFEFGPPAVLKPTHELLGEALLSLGRRDEAAGAFGRAAERTPGRRLVLAGLALTASSDR